MSTRPEFHSGLVRLKANFKGAHGIVFATNFSIFFPSQNIQECLPSLTLQEPISIKPEK